MYKKTHVVFFTFHLEHFWVFLMNALVYDYVDIDQGIHKYNSKMLKMKNEKKLCGFFLSTNMANFEAFHQKKKFSSSLLFLNLKSDYLIQFWKKTLLFLTKPNFTINLLDYKNVESEHKEDLL